MTKTIRKYHTWLVTLIGLQVLIWAGTGLYMTSLDIHYIHGEGLQSDKQVTIPVDDITYSFAQLSMDYPTARNMQLKMLDDRAVYQLRLESRWLLVDAASGRALDDISAEQAVRLVSFRYPGNGPVSSITLYETPMTPPDEFSASRMPAWQIVFDDLFSPTFYVHAQTGNVVTKRHLPWRIFDWMWRFHIMDYDDGGNVGNALLTVAMLLALLATLSGAVLTYRVFVPSNSGIYK